MKAKNSKKKIAIIVLTVTVVLIMVYLALGIYFNSHFWFRTVINGMNCSGKSIEQVESIITEEINDYQLKLEGRQGETEVIESTAISLHPVFDGSLQKKLESRSGFGWPVSLFKSTVIELETMVEYDEEKLKDAITKLQCMNVSKSRKPENAYISDYIEGTGYEIIPEVEGTLIDKETFLDIVHSSIINLQEKLMLADAGCYVEPEVRADNEELQKALEEINQCAAAVITYEFGSKKEVLDSATIHKWLSVTEDDKIVIDEEQAAEYIANIASEYNTYGKARSFATSYGATVHFYTNAYGWRIDQTDELTKLLEEIRSGETISREPVFSQRARSFDGNDYGSTYVEVNLTAQHLYFYKDGALIVESDFVSGNLAKGNGTPSGAYSLYYKQTDRILRGEDYATPVDYWMPFNGGVGLHDATWRSDFGGNYYKTSGSHGCINLPYSVAKKIYNNIEAGDAVFVYELPGTESTKGLAQDAALIVDNAITAIGNVTLESGAVISAARAAYDGLNDMAKGYVKYYDALVNAETVYTALAVQQQEAQAAAQAAEAVKQETVCDDIDSMVAAEEVEAGLSGSEGE